MSEELEYSAGEAAKFLGVSIGTIRKWSDDGHLRSMRTPGGHRRYSHEDLMDFLRKMRPQDYPEK